MNSCSNILRVEYLKFTTSGHGQDGGAPSLSRQDMGHYGHNKPHSMMIQSYIFRNIRLTTKPLMIHSRYLTIDANVVMLLHQMISVVCVCASVQFLTRSEGQTSDPIRVESSTSKYFCSCKFLMHHLHAVGNSFAHHIHNQYFRFSSVALIIPNEH